MSWQIITGDCVEQMARMDEASIDAIVCDPPYGLEFMGREWDRLGHGWPGGRSAPMGCPSRTHFKQTASANA